MEIYKDEKMQFKTSFIGKANIRKMTLIDYCNLVIHENDLVWEFEFAEDKGTPAHEWLFALRSEQEEVVMEGWLQQKKEAKTLFKPGAKRIRYV